MFPALLGSFDSCGSSDDETFDSTFQRVLSKGAPEVSDFSQYHSTLNSSRETGKKESITMLPTRRLRGSSRANPYAEDQLYQNPVGTGEASRSVIQGELGSDGLDATGYADSNMDLNSRNVPPNVATIQQEVPHPLNMGDSSHGFATNNTPNLVLTSNDDEIYYNVVDAVSPSPHTLDSGNRFSYRTSDVGALTPRGFTQCSQMRSSFQAINEHDTRSFVRQEGSETAMQNRQHVYQNGSISGPVRRQSAQDMHNAQFDSNFNSMNYFTVQDLGRYQRESHSLQDETMGINGNRGTNPQPTILQVGMNAAPSVEDNPLYSGVYNSVHTMREHQVQAGEETPIVVGGDIPADAEGEYAIPAGATNPAQLQAGDVHPHHLEVGSAIDPDGRTGRNRVYIRCRHCQRERHIRLNLCKHCNRSR